MKLAGVESMAPSGTRLSLQAASGGQEAGTGNQRAGGMFRIVRLKNADGGNGAENRKNRQLHLTHSLRGAPGQVAVSVGSLSFLP